MQQLYPQIWIGEGAFTLPSRSKAQINYRMKNKGLGLMENMDVTLFLNYTLYLDVQFFVDGNQFPAKCTTFQCGVVIPSVDPESDHDIEILLFFDKSKKESVLTTGIDLEYFHNQVFD
jgi:hypothetical protein